jgi:hypothetical protein
VTVDVDCLSGPLWDTGRLQGRGPEVVRALDQRSLRTRQGNLVRRVRPSSPQTRDRGSLQAAASVPSRP